MISITKFYCVIIILLYGIAGMYNNDLPDIDHAPNYATINSVILDTISQNNTLNDTISNTTEESINQQGENNTIEISNSDSTKNSKNTININQTGKNNSVKIRTQ